MLRRPLVLAVVMTLFMMAFEYAVLGTPYLSYAQDAFSAGPLVGLLRVAGQVAIVAVEAMFFLASLTAPRGWRPIYALLFAWVVFTQYGYVRATGGFLNAHDFEIAAAETPHWGAMIARFVNWTAAVPTAVYGLALAASRPSTTPSPLRRFAVAVALVAGLHSTYAAWLYTHADEDAGLRADLAPPMDSLQGFARAGTMFVWNRAATGYLHARLGGRAPVPSQTDRTPARHVVLIVDETIRADHLSLNGYARPTTPWLDAHLRTGGLTNWGVAASATPTSNASVLSLMTGVHLLPDRDRRTMTQPTIFQFAKAMRYETHLFDGGTRQLRFGFEFDDLDYVDDWGARDRFGDDSETDFRIARAVSSLLERPAGQFIVVLKRGNHWPYVANYPADRAIWRPDDDADDATAIVNGFDNAIRYNVDGFFQAVAGSPGFARAVILYTSDHGAFLDVAREPGLAREVTWGDAAVPMFLIGRDLVSVDSGYRASHANVMPTLLDLMAVPREARTAGYARSLLGATASDVDPRRVFSGAFFGTDTHLVQDFDTLPAARH